MPRSKRITPRKRTHLATGKPTHIPGLLQCQCDNCGKGFTFPEERIPGENYYQCQCECGRMTIVSESDLLSGRRTSCGLCDGEEKK